MTSDVETKVVASCRRVAGVVRVPGDKSISHRVAMLSALATGESRIEGFLTALDCLGTLEAVRQLGATVDRERDRVRIVGTGGRFRAPSTVLDLGNSGTGMRLLSGLLAAHEFTTELTGDESLRSRPMKRVKVPLERMGAVIELLGANGCAPMRIRGGALHAIEFVMPMASAQVKSCTLLAGLFAEGTTVVVEPAPTRDHTETLMMAMGLPLRQEGSRVSIQGTGGAPLRLAGAAWTVPGDFSSAAFWMAAAACREGSEVRIENVGINPRRTAFLDVLRRMGAEITVLARPKSANNRMDCEPAADLVIRGQGLKGTEVGGEEIPNLIDEIPILSVCAAFACGQTVIRDAQELRVKESDRIRTMVNNLRAIGVNAGERPDGMVVEGGATPKGGVTVESFGDHRVAMSMAIAALFSKEPVCVRNTACVDTSYPGFWDDLNRTRQDA